MKFAEYQLSIDILRKSKIYNANDSLRKENDKI